MKDMKVFLSKKKKSSNMVVKDTKLEEQKKTAC